MPEDLVPPVVAVVVSFDPGPWLEECLESLVNEDYANLSVLVIDAGSSEPLATRVAAVAPGIFLHRLEQNEGFGPSANAVLDLVEGSAHFLFCHDDIVAKPDAVRRLVEEAFRSNAAVVGPKFVDPEEPDRLLQLGLGVDRFGAPVRRVTRGEFDQAQHDEVREVFAVPGGFTLVRSDLFAAIGGFDPTISMFGEDVDLCWRARIAGGRVVVVPAAEVGHREATAGRRRPLPSARLLQWRHELRAVLKNYGGIRLCFIVVQLGLLSLAEMSYFGLRARRRRAADVARAWRWNLSRTTGLRAARNAVQATRLSSDRVVCELMAHRSFRLWRSVRPMLEDAVIRARRRRSHRGNLDWSRRARHEQRPAYVTAGAVVAGLVLLFGVRSFLVDRLPLIGDYAPFPGPTTLLGAFFGGNVDAGLQHTGPSTPAFALLGAVGLVLGGSMGLLEKALIVLLVLCGAAGVARIVRPLGPSSARLVAALCYLFVPLPYDDLARGDLAGLIAYAGVPYVALRLARSTGVPPFVPGDRVGIAGRRTVEEVIGLGILVAVLGAFAPSAVLLTVVVAVLFLFGAVIVGDSSSGLRVMIVAVGGVFVAFVLLFPWSLTFVQRGARWSALVGAVWSPARAPSLSAIFRFDVGPVGAGRLGDATLAAALAVLVLGRGSRLNWAMRLWVVVLGTAAFTWAAAEGWLGSGGGDLGVFLAPAAVALAVLVGLGIAAVTADVRRARFGWRHLVVIAFGLAAFIGAVPVLGATLGGRFGTPSVGYETVLSLDSTKNPAAERVLWLGDPAALPLVGWQVRPGLAAAVSVGGLPDAQRLWPSPDPGVANGLIADVMRAESGLTVRLGADLAASGVRYVVVPTTTAPLLTGVQSSPSDPPPESLLDGLAAQSDLKELPVEGGALVFENTAWRPTPVPASLSRGGGTPSFLRALAVGFELLVWIGLIGLAIERRRRRARHVRRVPYERPSGPIDEEAAPTDMMLAEGSR